MPDFWLSSAAVSAGLRNAVDIAYQITAYCEMFSCSEKELMEYTGLQRESLKDNGTKPRRYNPRWSEQEDEFLSECYIQNLTVDEIAEELNRVFRNGRTARAVYMRVFHLRSLGISCKRFSAADIPDQQIEALREAVRNGVSYVELSRQTGIHPSTLWKILNSNGRIIRQESKHGKAD